MPEQKTSSRPTVYSLKEDLDKVTKKIDDHQSLLRGSNGNPGLVGQILLMEQKLSSKIDSLAAQLCSAQEKSVTWQAVLTEWLKPILVAVLTYLLFANFK